MSAPLQKKAKVIEDQLAATESSGVCFLYEGDEGGVPYELRSEITRVRIAPQVTEISKCAFRNCKKLVEVQLNEGLQNIRFGAFVSCMALQSVIIPSTVTELGKGIFCWCQELSEVHLNEGLRVVGEMTFHRCTALRSISLPSTVTELGKRAFDGCTKLVEARLNEGQCSLDHGQTGWTRIFFPRSTLHSSSRRAIRVG